MDQIGKKLNILFLEDNLTLRISIEHILKSFEQNVFCFDNPEDLIDTFNDDYSSIDLLVSDINMPKMNGLQFIHKLREDGYKFPVIIITSHRISELKKDNPNLDLLDIEVI